MTILSLLSKSNQRLIELQQSEKPDVDDILQILFNNAKLLQQLEDCETNFYAEV